MITEPTSPSANPGILYVDDENAALRMFQAAFASEYNVLIASSAQQGMDILMRQADSISIVVSDQRMPERTGVDFLCEVKEIFPEKVRILTTAYSDLSSAIKAVNEGRIYQYVVKPWDLRNLSQLLKRATDYYQVFHERNRLFSLKMQTVQRIMLSDRVKALTTLARFDAVPHQDRLIKALATLVRSAPKDLDFYPGGSGTQLITHTTGDLIGHESRVIDVITEAWGKQPASKEEAMRAFQESVKAEAPDLGFELRERDGFVELLTTNASLEWTRVSSLFYGTFTAEMPSPSSLNALKLIGILSEEDEQLIIEFPQEGVRFNQIVFGPEPDCDLQGLLNILDKLFDRWDRESLGV